MKQVDVIALAHEAGTTFVTKQGVASATTEWLERFARLVQQATADRCAKLCDAVCDPKPNDYGDGYNQGAIDCYRAIRAKFAAKEGGEG